MESNMGSKTNKEASAESPNKVVFAEGDSNETDDAVFGAIREGGPNYRNVRVPDSQSFSIND